MSSGIRGIPQVGLAVDELRGLVFAEHVLQRDGVGHGLNTVHVHLFELFDVADDSGQLRPEFLLLLGLQGQPC